MRFIRTRNQYIGVIFFAIALLALEILRVPTPMSLGWYDCVPGNQNGHCFVPTHLGSLGFFNIIPYRCGPHFAEIKAKRGT